MVRTVLTATCSHPLAGETNDQHEARVHAVPYEEVQSAPDLKSV